MTHLSTVVPRCTHGPFLASKIVNFSDASTKRGITAQTLVLTGLTHPEVGPRSQVPLVSMEIVSPLPSSNIHWSNSDSSTEYLRFDAEEGQPSIKSLLMKDCSVLQPSLLARRTVDLDRLFLDRVLSSWETKNEIEKLLLCASAFNQDRAIAFSLRFSMKRERKLRALAGGHFRFLRTDLGPLGQLGPYAACLERDESGKLHAHGFVATDAPETEVRQALRKLGGHAADVRFRNLFQARTRPASQVVCWANYMLKQIVDLRRPGDWIYISQQAKQAGRDHLPVLKALAQTKLGVMAGRTAPHSPRASIH